jgi:bacillithiol system protein YtxJ
MIFKHSTRCSISSLALNRIENVKNQETIIKSCYFLDLLSYRDISNKIATDFNVIHASPQILIIKNGKCIYNTSHSNINWANIKI